MSRLPLEDFDPTEIPPEKRGLLESYPLGTMLASAAVRDFLVESRRRMRARIPLEETETGRFILNEVFLVHTGPGEWSQAEMHFAEGNFVFWGKEDRPPSVDPFPAHPELGEEPVWDGYWDSLTEDSVLGYLNLMLVRTEKEMRAPLRYRQVYVEEGFPQQMISEVLAPRPPTAPQRRRGMVTFHADAIRAVYAMESHLQHALMGMRQEEARLSAPLVNLAAQDPGMTNHLHVALSAQAQLAQKRTQWLQFLGARLHTIVLKLMRESGEVRYMNRAGRWSTVPSLGLFRFGMVGGKWIHNTLDARVDFLAVATRDEVDAFNRSDEGREGKPWWMGVEPVRPNDVLFFGTYSDIADMWMPVRMSSSHLQLRDLSPRAPAPSHTLLLPSQLEGETWVGRSLEDKPLLTKSPLESDDAPRVRPRVLVRRRPPPPNRTPAEQTARDMHYIATRLREPEPAEEEEEEDAMEM
jgi:hypothetical protein